MCCLQHIVRWAKEKTRLQSSRVFCKRGGRDSNPQQPARQAGTLTNWATAPIGKRILAWFSHWSRGGMRWFFNVNNLIKTLFYVSNAIVHFQDSFRFDAGKVHKISPPDLCGHHARWGYFLNATILVKGKVTTPTLHFVSEVPNAEGMIWDSKLHCLVNFYVILELLFTKFTNLPN